MNIKDFRRRINLFNDKAEEFFCSNLCVSLLAFLCWVLAAVGMGFLILLCVLA